MHGSHDTLHTNAASGCMHGYKSGPYKGFFLRINMRQLWCSGPKGR